MEIEVLNEFLQKGGFDKVSKINKIELTFRNKDGYTPISLAAKYGRWDLVLNLAQQIQRIENLNDNTRSGSVLLDAVVENKSKVVDELLKIKNIDVNWHYNSGDNRGYGPLHLAIQNNDLELAKRLIVYGFDVNTQFEFDQKRYPSPLEIALANKNWKAIQLLAEYQADLTVKDKDGYTPISLAAKYGRWDLVLNLAQQIQKIENLNDNTRSGSVLLDAVVENKSKVVDELLKIKNIDVNWHYNSGENRGYGPLHLAIENNNLELAKRLIVYGFDINTQFEFDQKRYPSPLEIALTNKNWKAFHFLVKNKADLKTMLENSQYELDVFIEDVIIEATRVFNKVNKKDFELVSDEKIKLQTIILDSVISNKLFIKKYLFDSDKKDKTLIIQILASDIGSNGFKLETVSQGFFKKKEYHLILKGNYSIPSFRLDDCMQSISNTTEKVSFVESKKATKLLIDLNNFTVNNTKETINALSKYELDEFFNGDNEGEGLKPLLEVTDPFVCN